MKGRVLCFAKKLHYDCKIKIFSYEGKTLKGEEEFSILKKSKLGKSMKKIHLSAFNIISNFIYCKKFKNLTSHQL